MDYTYQPQATERNGGLFGAFRSFVTGSSASKHRKQRPRKQWPVNSDSDRSAADSPPRKSVRADTGAPVKTVVLGKSLLSRLGYWLLIRGAGATTPSHNWRGAGKKSKVTRSELRQNKVAEDLVSIETANGNRRLVRVSDGRQKRAPTNGTPEKRTGVSPKQSKESAVNTALSAESRKTGGSGVVAVVQRRKAINKSYPDHRFKKFEQDLFVKTERNIAAAMKEARQGISAEQLVVKFGLSVPEAGLIASKCK